jgi:hypothetical protein
MQAASVSPIRPNRMSRMMAFLMKPPAERPSMMAELWHNPEGV